MSQEEPFPGKARRLQSIRDWDDLHTAERLQTIRHLRSMATMLEEQGINEHWHRECEKRLQSTLQETFEKQGNFVDEIELFPPELDDTAIESLLDQVNDQFSAQRTHPDVRLFSFRLSSCGDIAKRQFIFSLGDTPYLLESENTDFRLSLLYSLPRAEVDIPSVQEADVYAGFSLSEDFECQLIWSTMHGDLSQCSADVYPLSPKLELSKDLLSQLLLYALNPAEALRIALRSQEIEEIESLLDIYEDELSDRDVRDPDTGFSLLGGLIYERGKDWSEEHLLRAISRLSDRGFSLTEGAEQGKCALSASLLRGRMKPSASFFERLIIMGANPTRVRINGLDIVTAAREHHLSNEVVSLLESSVVRQSISRSDTSDHSLGL